MSLLYAKCQDSDAVQGAKLGGLSLTPPKRAAKIPRPLACVGAKLNIQHTPTSSLAKNNRQFFSRSLRVYVTSALLRCSRLFCGKLRESAFAYVLFILPR
jgi:hypothetical protein